MSDDATLVLDWLESGDAARLRQTDLAEGGGSLAAHLVAAGRPALADGLAGAEGEMGGGEGPPAAVQFVLAQALARYVALDPAHERFEAADQLLGHDRGVWRAFRHEAAGAIAADPTARSSLEQRLQAEPALLLLSPELVAMHSRVPPADLAEHHSRSASVRDMWAPNGFISTRLRSGLEHDVLRAIDPGAWLRTVEMHSFIEPVVDLVESANFKDMAELVPILGAAAPAFDGDGRWQRDRFSVFPLLTSAGHILRGRAGLDPLLGPADASAFAADLDSLIDALAARPDWTWLGHAWLQRLAWEEYATGAWAPSPAVAVGEPLWRVMVSVAARLQPLEHPLAWIREEEATWRLNRLVAALVPLAVVADGKTAPDLLEEVVKENLATSTMIPRVLQDRRTASVRVLASALEELPAPSLWLRRAWDGAFGSRDRLRSWRGRSVADGRDAGAVAAAAACALLVRSLGDPDRQARSNDLWDALRGSVVETWLTIPEPRDAAWEVCADWLARTFQPSHLATLPAERRSRLAAFLNPLEAPSRGFVGVLAALVRTGVPVGEIDEALEGLTVAEITARAIEDARRSAPAGYHDRAALAELERVGAELRASTVHSATVLD